MTSSRTNTLFLLPLRITNDSILVWTLRLAAAVAGAIAVLILFYLVKESLPALAEVGITRFFTDSSWHPSENLYNLTPMLAGTLLVMAGAVFIATPLGIFSAIFCQYYAPSFMVPLYRRLMEVLAGIPSVVYGFWGLMVLVPAVNEIRAPGASLLAATLVLAIMVLPTIALMADAALENVPQSYITAAHALGLSRQGILRIAVFPAAKSGLFTGVILETGRAIGETMAVLMVCGNIVQLPSSIFDPVRTLTANIALEMAYATGTHRSSLFVSGLVLLGLVIALVTAADLISGRSRAH